MYKAMGRNEMVERRWIIESERLGLRKLVLADAAHLGAILRDEEIMYAWEHAFTEDEVQDWIHENIRRYEAEGFSYFAAIEKASNRLVGMMGPLVERVNGSPEIGIAYILHKAYWGKGFAVEGAGACMAYAFSHLKADRVTAAIRPENTASCRVAQSLGMQIAGVCTKHYRGKNMQHFIYSRER